MNQNHQYQQFYPQGIGYPINSGRQVLIGAENYQLQSNSDSSTYTVPSPILLPTNEHTNYNGGDHLVPGERHSISEQMIIEGSSPYHSMNTIGVSNQYTPSLNHVGYPMLDRVPSLTIKEQPKSAFRFRYNCEGSSHGALLGDKSEKNRKSYPSVYLQNYFGHAVIVASLVSTVNNYPHPFCLTGKNVTNGLFIWIIKDGSKQGTEVRLKDLSILHVKKQEVATALQHRIAIEAFIETYGIYEYMNRSQFYSEKLKQNSETEDDQDENQKSFGAFLIRGMTASDRKEIKDRANEYQNELPLNAVRLCFKAYLFEKPNSNKQSCFIGPVYSIKITDTKNCPALKICKIDKCVGSAAGNETIFLLCDKISREDIHVIFQEEHSGIVSWEDKGEFQPSEVHHQVAIVFQTPPYKYQNISEAVTVNVKLRKNSTNDESQPVTFQYIPEEFTKTMIGEKRSRLQEMNNIQQIVPISRNASFNPALGSIIVNQGQLMDPPSDGADMSLNWNDPNSGISGFPDILEYLNVTNEANHLTLQAYSSLIPNYGQNDVESDGPQIPAKEQKLPPSSTLETSKSEIVSDRGQASLKLLDRYHHLTQRSLDRHYKSIQGFAYSGDVSKLIDPLLPMFYLHNHKHKDTLLHSVILKNQVSAFKAMIHTLRMHSRHTPTVINMVNSYYETPLHIAVELNNSECVSELLSSGANILCADCMGNTPIHIAVKNSYTNCLQLLVDALLDNNSVIENIKNYILTPDIYNYDGHTPIHTIIHSENWQECLELLLKAGSDINAEERREGLTLLHMAVLKNNISMVSYLLFHEEFNIDLNVTSFSDSTPLHFALENKKIKIAALLIKANADLDIENSYNQTAKTLCEGDPELAKLLSDSAIPPDISDLYLLSTDAKKKLSNCLDLNNWETLATELDLDPTVYQKLSNPGVQLINDYELKGGSLALLSQVLNRLAFIEEFEILKPFVNT